MLFYFLLIIAGVLNALLSGSLYGLLGSLLFKRGGALVLLVNPIYIFSTSIPILYFYFLLLEIPIASFVVLFLFRRLDQSGRKYIFSFLLTVIVFSVLQFIAIVVPPFFQQATIERKNPIEQGTKRYDFSQAVIFNSRLSAKNTLRIEKNKIVWIEHTKEPPTYPKNIWDVFLFEFAPTTSQGTATQLTHLEDARDGSAESAGVFDGGVYWTQDAKLYTYNPSSGKAELISEGVSAIYGKSSNYLVASHGSNPNIYGVKKGNLFLYDLATKREVDLSSLNENVPFGGASTPFNVMVGGSNVCYEISGGIKRYGLTTQQRDSIAGDTLIDCQNNYVAYAYKIGPSASDPTTTLTVKVDQMEPRKTVFTKEMRDPTNRVWVRGRLDNNRFYFSFGTGNAFSDSDYEPGANSIARVDLATGKEAIILTQNKIMDWDIDADYLVYQKSAGGYNTHLYLQGVSPEF
ncbi:hypothetical protein HYZ80_02390 [Candidatus Parcubacteria bacterium]|nr:hypothetical protein [Candidatus Parcubacteria bacterium]